MECMSALSTGHEISPLEAAQQRSRVVYTVPSTDLFIQADSIVIEESRNLISSAGTTGMRTWDAALHLATYFVSANLISGKRILELGAGTGFLSILCMDVLGAQSVLATDGSLPVVTAIENNIALNDHPRMTQSSRKIEARVLEWGQNSPAEGALKIRSQDTTLDMVIGADVVRLLLGHHHHITHVLHLADLQCGVNQSPCGDPETSFQSLSVNSSSHFCYCAKQIYIPAFYKRLWFVNSESSLIRLSLLTSF